MQVGLSEDGTDGYVASLIPYRNNQKCVTQVQTKCRRVQFRFSMMNIEQTSPVDCVHDRVFIQSPGEFDSGPLCGYDTGSIAGSVQQRNYSVWNEVLGGTFLVAFETDRQLVFNGFSLIFKVV